MRQQAKLLRVLETGEIERVGSSRTKRVDVRVISATNTDLQDAIAAGHFREDLLFRLNTVEIHLPAAARTPRRYPCAGGAFPVALCYALPHSQVTGFARGRAAGDDAVRWPGNVRELEHTLERAVLMCRSCGDPGLRPRSECAQRPQGQNLEELSIEEVEGILVRKALQRFHGNVSQAAEALGLSRGALYRRMERYGL